MNGEKFNSDRAPQAVGLYPHARKVGDLLFLSGVGPRKPGETEIPGVTLDDQGEIIQYDIEQQCHSVFKTSNIYWKILDHLGIILWMFKYFLPI